MATMNMKDIYSITYKKERNPYRTYFQNQNSRIGHVVVRGEAEMKAKCAEMVSAGIEIINVHNGVGNRVAV